MEHFVYDNETLIIIKSYMRIVKICILAIYILGMDVANFNSTNT